LELTMNARKARALRRLTLGAGDDRSAYRRLKRASTHGCTARAQQAKAVKPRRHKPTQESVPTWPGTPNQLRQSRPIIVQQPLRQTSRKAASREDIRDWLGNWPKRALDRLALAHPREQA
jgi:hypothetical protein